MAVNEIAAKLVAFYEKLEVEKLNQERFYIKSRLEEKISKIQEAIIPLDTFKGQSEKEKQCIEEIKQAIRKLMTLANKLEDKFSIFIIGDGNAGKSTVVNALLGKEVAKMKFDPMTWKIDVFHDEQAKEVQLVTYDRKGNQVSTLSIEDAQKLIEQEEEKREASVHKIQANIKEKTEAIQKICKAQHLPFREVADKLEAYKERLWREELYTSDIVEAKWPVETNEILANFQIVDTPGLRQNRLATALSESIKRYYDEADGIIWVMDMNKIAMNSTKNYIREIEEELFGKTKACEQKQMLALLNRSDCVRTDEEKSHILEQAQAMYGDEFSGILPFSATKALKARLEGNEALLQESGYRTLEDHINIHFLKGANQVKTEKLLREIQKEEMKFQVIISYYIQELEGKLKEHRACNKEIVQAFTVLQEESQMKLSDMILSYERVVQSHIEKFTEALFEGGQDKEAVLKEDIFNRTTQERELKELVQGVLKQVERIRSEYLDKLGLRRVTEYPMQVLFDEMSINQYFEQMEMDLELEKIENHPLRKLVSGISAVKKMVDKPYVEECKEKLFEGLKQLVETMTHHLSEELQASLWQEQKQILDIRQEQFDEIYGNDKQRINQLYALKTIERLLSEPTKESTITDYIKGMGDGRWNNI